ncbi:DUF3592 domain-containing protein [Solirubrum puertoriconensis]|uniref:DUF3592 domain-containing protein n=1 Tax=Solirubrum puertoriconensis TaxID=1751427 RepID=A0A9X0L5P5_SOLP1|nr:DUF3592 domain-containing protein [Solirubrum puertoriconensis]KUG08896.1 hypothetical protein ASU33_12300 [Solirubrum puertoriconensis]
MDAFLMLEGIAVTFGFAVRTIYDTINTRAFQYDSIPAQATLVKWRLQKRGESPYRTKYELMPLLRFTTEYGEVIEGYTESEMSSIFNRPGKRVDVMYSPSNPYDFIIYDPHPILTAIKKAAVFCLVFGIIVLAEHLGILQQVLGAE